MTEMFVIIVVSAGVAAGIWYVLRPRRAAAGASVSEVARESGAKVSEAVRASGAKISHAARTSGTKVTAAFKGLWQRVRGRRRDGNLARQFQAWVVDSGSPDRKQFYQGIPQTAGAFSDWLAGLRSEEIELFSQRISDVVSGWNIQIDWLVGEQLQRVPALRQAVEESVLLHCLAHWRASQAQSDIRTFVTFQAWQQDPHAGRQKELNQKLYSRLVEKGLLEAPAPDLLLASEDRRHDYVVQALRQASQADVTAFSSTLQEIAAPLPETMPAEQPPTEQPSRHSQAARDFAPQTARDFANSTGLREPHAAPQPAAASRKMRAASSRGAPFPTANTDDGTEHHV